MFASNSRHVFIDESGDPYLDVEKPGVSSFFVLSAVIVPSEDLDPLIKRAREIINVHFNQGEMKSSSVGKNHTRRKNILSSMATVPFKHYSQVIDKSEILTDSGLSYKKSFVKFINRTMYQRLFKTFPYLHVIADEHGTSDFMNEFGRYIQRRIPNTLFETSSFQFGNSKEHPLIQFSDMVAGSIARVYSGKDSIEILEPLRNNTIIIDEWPPKFPVLISDDQNEIEFKYSHMVREQAVSLAKNFIDQHSNEDEFELQAQVAAVRYLLYHFRSVDPQEYIPTPLLHLHLSQLGYDMSIRKLRSQIIGKLRDQSVFIVSSSKGIKIPYNVSELKKFAKQVDDRVKPYLHRLEIIRNHYLLRSEGELDIVDNNELPNLAQILNSGT
ncbi:MAG: DUF3800 domain-containing protein [Calditrichaceae bacterium]